MVRRVRVLLDTHVLLWARSSPDRLTSRQRAAVQDPRNTVFVSAVSIAEIGIKTSHGKLTVPDGFTEGLADFGLDELPFTTAHALALRELPPHHRDPFDRMLLCQAIVDDLVFVTSDQRCALYEVRTL